MIGLLCFALAVLASPFKSKLRLEAENTVLRHQLIVLRRRLHGRVRFTNNDRWFLFQLYRWFPSCRFLADLKQWIRADFFGCVNRRSSSLGLRRAAHSATRAAGEFRS